MPLFLLLIYLVEHFSVLQCQVYLFLCFQSIALNFWCVSLALYEDVYLVCCTGIGGNELSILELLVLLGSVEVDCDCLAL